MALSSKTSYIFENASEDLKKFREKQEKYWQDRAEQNFLLGEKQGLALSKSLQKNYEDSLKQIQKEINAFYGKYAKDNQITWADARKLLNDIELKSFKSSLNDYIQALKKAGYPKEQILELQNLYTKSRISRLEELKANINYELMKLTEETNNKMQNYFYDTFEDQYYRTIFDVDQNIGLATSFTKPDTKTIEKALSKNYNLANFSINGKDAVWKRKDYLMQILTQKIPQGLTLGYNPRKLGDLVSKQLQTDYNATVRLIRTEYNALQNEATAEGYKQCGIQQYQILATLDDRTSKICQDMDGEIEDLSKKEVGVNYPPFHPNCRTTTIPYFEPDEIDAEFGIGTRLAKDKDGKYYEVPANMSYSEWRKGLQNNGNGEIANKQHVTEDLSVPTLAGAPLGKPMTMKQAGGGNVNPNYDKNIGYQTNCQSCVVTYEARLRGYDVQALPNTFKLTGNETDKTLLNELANDMTLAYFKPGTLERPDIDKIYAGSTNKAYEELDKLIEKDKRYEISIKWKSQDSSHIMMIYRNKDNILEIYDPQENEIFTGGSINLWRLQYAETGRKHKDGSRYPIKVMRVDNLDIDECTAKYIMEAKNEI